MDSLKKPVALVKVLNIVICCVTLGLCVGSHPRKELKEIAKHIRGDDFWKYYLLLSFVVIGLLYNILSIAALMLLSEKSQPLKILDAVINAILGLLFIISAGLLIGELVDWDDFFEICQYPFRSNSRVWEPPLKKCFTSENPCRCVLRDLFKFDVSVASGSIAIINGVLFFVTAGLSFLK